MRTVRAICLSSLVALLCSVAANSSPQTQLSCDQVGDHLIKVSAAPGSGQLVDCEAARISKQAKHKITWQAAGDGTLTIEFAAKKNPFLKFSCRGRKICTADRIDPKALGEFKYTVTLKTGGKTYKEDPGVIIEQ